MNIDTVKIEIIDWITGLNDPQLIKKILSLSKSLEIITNDNQIQRYFA